MSLLNDIVTNMKVQVMNSAYMPRVHLEQACHTADLVHNTCTAWAPEGVLKGGVSVEDLHVYVH